MPGLEGQSGPIVVGLERWLRETKDTLGRRGVRGPERRRQGVPGYREATRTGPSAVVWPRGSPGSTDGGGVDGPLEALSAELGRRCGEVGVREGGSSEAADRVLQKLS